jgi:hypothetical protein
MCQDLALFFSGGFIPWEWCVGCAAHGVMVLTSRGCVRVGFCFLLV